MNQKEIVSSIANHCYEMANLTINELSDKYQFTFGITSFATKTSINRARVIYLDNIHMKLVFDDKNEIILVVNTLDESDTLVPDEYERIKLALAVNFAFSTVEDVTSTPLMMYTHGIFDYLEV